MTVAVVTDSTACLPEHLVGETAAGPTRTVPTHIVPLSVLIEHDTYVEGLDVSAGELAWALAHAGMATTSRPSPAAFLDLYERLAAQGVDEIVSVHVSGALSGTCDSATLAAGVSPVPVHVVDSRSMAMGLGFAALDAVRVLAAGADAATAAAVARATADGSAITFCVASLDFLRRGGRIGAASAFLGGALAVKPVLRLDDGRIAPVEKQRTLARASARLVSLSAEEAPPAAGVRLAVHHVGAPEQAQTLATALHERYAGAAAPPAVVELGLVGATHLGPGTLGVVIAPPTPLTASSSTA